MSQQGLRQQAFRAIGGGTGAYEGDARAAFAAEATITSGMTYNGALIAWLRERLSSSDGHLGNLMAAFAADQGADSWSGVGEFDPAGVLQDGLLAEWRMDAGDGATTQVITDYGPNGLHGVRGADSSAASDDPAWANGGLTFDSGDHAILTNDLASVVQGFDIAFSTGAEINATSTRYMGLLGLANESAGVSGFSMGSSWASTLLAAEVMGIRHTIASGFGADAACGRLNDAVATGWHLIQMDLRPGEDAGWNMRIDGIEVSISKGTNKPGEFVAGLDWSIGHSSHTVPAVPMVGYVTLYSTARTNDQQDENRAVIVAALAARGITLP